MRKEFILSSVILSATFALLSFIHTPLWLIGIAFLTPIILLGTFDLFDKKHTIIANYPIFGRFRYVMEELRPKFINTSSKVILMGHQLIESIEVSFTKGRKKFSTQRHLEHKQMFISPDTSG